VLKQAGGLHKFMNWDRPILTDSGGYQVYSLAANRKLKEDGVEFRSHIDGSKLWFTPENIMDTQREIGADIIMAFDECTPWPCEKAYAEKSMNLTHRWLKRCVDHFNNTARSQIKTIISRNSNITPSAKQKIENLILNPTTKQAIENCGCNRKFIQSGGQLIILKNNKTANTHNIQTNTHHNKSKAYHKSKINHKINSKSKTNMNRHKII
jgi:hypothetical protein